MPPDETLKQLILQAKSAKADRQFDRAAQLYAEASRAAAAQNDARQQRDLLRKSTVCVYMNPAKLKDNRKNEALALLVGPVPGIAALIELAGALKGENAFGPARMLLAEARTALKNLIYWNAAQRGPFQPKYHNWRPKTKVPILVLNATKINTWHNWQFTTSFMGESPLSIDPEVDGNDRMRRLYYGDAPTDDLKTLRLGRAVGASACVPVVFEPIVLSGLYPGKTVRLADGGVHDNQGVVGLLEQDCTVLLISDASGHVGVEDDPKPSELGVAVRSNDLLMARVRGAQYRDLKGRLRSRVIRGLMFLHLRKDLDVDPVDWVGCQDPSPPPRHDPLTSYGIRKDVQDRLASIRTDLDSLGEAEAFALMTSGYCMTDRVFPQSVEKLLTTSPRREDWPFLQIHGALEDLALSRPAEHADLMNVLDVGRHQFFKIFYLTPWLMRTAKVILGLVLLALLATCFVYRSSLLLTAGMIGTLALPALAACISVWLADLIFLKQAILGFMRNLVIAVFGWLVAILHVNTFDKWYLRRGTDYRVLNTPYVPPPP